MEKFLKAAIQAWNPIGEVQRRLLEESLTVSEVLAPAITAIIACNLVRTAAWNFFWNSTFHGLGGQVPELKTNEFITQLGSTVGALAPVAVLSLLPASVFRPFGRSAVAAALLLLGSADAFYLACFAAVGYFVAGAQAWEHPQVGMTTFSVISIVMVVAELAIVLYLWLRIGLAILRLSVASFIGITISGLLGLLLLVFLVFLVAS